MATFPLNHPLPNGKYSYVFCEQTFPSGREMAWKKFINHAFSQWELVTNDLVTLDLLEVDADGNELGCVDYSMFVEIIRTKVKNFETDTGLPGGRPPTDEQIAAHALHLLSNLHEAGIDQSDVLSTMTEDAMLSEVFMIDDSPNVLVRVGVFPEVSEKVGHGWCRYACAPATVQFRLDGSQVITTDIKLRRSEFEGISLDVPGPDDTADEGEVPFNSCRSGGVANEYGVLVHEAGHALGIREANDGIEQILHHPNYKRRRHGRHR